MVGTREAVGQMIAEARQAVEVYVAQQPEEHDLGELLSGLNSICEGDFEVPGSVLWDLWDAIGLVPDRSPMLDQLYVMLGMMNTLTDWGSVEGEKSL